MLPYGVIMQVKYIYIISLILINISIIFKGLLYSNENRTESNGIPLSLGKIGFKPYFSLFGEMFKAETATYAFDTYDTCTISEVIDYRVFNKHIKKMIVNSINLVLWGWHSFGPVL